MLTELFLNSCLSLVLNNTTKLKKTKVIYRDIIDILNFFKEKEKNEIPINIKNKIECLNTICELKLEDKTDDNVIDSISFGEKYKSLLDFIHYKRTEQLTEEELSDNISQIRMRKKLNSVVSNYSELSFFLEKIKSGNFESIDEVIFNYEKLIKDANYNLTESSRSIGLEACSTLDLLNDDYTPVLDMIKKKYDKNNTVHTGYTIFDQDVFDNGGFEKSRLYIFGGGSGSGKSTLMLNFINNDISTPIEKDSKNKSNVYVYITLENQIDESLLRLYQMMFEKDTATVLRDIVSGVDIKKEILAKVKSSGYNLVFKYFPKFSISCTDIRMHLDDVVQQYGIGSIRGLYVDYLDLLKADVSKYDMYRLELGFITAGLKDIAVDYNTPVISPTQLGRSVYKNNDSHSLNLDMMSESIKKVEHADFISLMSKDPVDPDAVHLKIGKNRCGRDNVAIDFKVKFKYYKFLHGLKVANDRKNDLLSDQVFDVYSFDNKTKVKTKVPSFGGIIEKVESTIINNDF